MSCMFGFVLSTQCSSKHKTTKQNVLSLVTNLKLVDHTRSHTVAAAEGSHRQQVLTGNSCCQQQQAGHMIHNSAGHSSAESRDTLAAR